MLIQSGAASGSDLVHLLYETQFSISKIMMLESFVFPMLDKRLAGYSQKPGCDGFVVVGPFQRFGDKHFCHLPDCRQLFPSRNADAFL